jgi:hypothetical protein
MIGMTDLDACAQGGGGLRVLLQRGDAVVCRLRARSAPSPSPDLSQGIIKGCHSLHGHLVIACPHAPFVGSTTVPTNLGREQATLCCIITIFIVFYYVTSLLW